ncbi:hypothetical protein SBF1_3740014 [Candidatus Desulfosporosinus infrequens]|uniref:PAS domain S-box protein n=1 Tax=Candidatus Desulfosporosinus infrequens TaxID=2043169 RepID=A0A2U3L4X9_9FIRM|nr:hypothetical protein SBF1_3740014 [Candidatus Desulfosporosinus infrequens]
MNDKDRNKEELINELIQLRKRNTELKSSLMEGNPGDLVLPIIDHGRTTNITERKEVKEGLYRSNQKLNEILSSIQDDFYVLDRDWNFVYANRQFTSRIDKEPQDFIGNNIWRMFPKHIGTEYEENIRSVMDKREIRRFDVGGKYTDSYYQMAVFPSEEGITVLGIDITEQKKAEKRIKEQNAQLLQQINLTSMQANLLNLSNEAIFVWDLNGAITYWNAGAEKMYGYSSKEAVGSVSHDLLKTVHPIAIGNIIFMLERYKSWNGEVEHTSKFGKKLYIETSHQVILNELGQQIVLETNRDITQRKKMENDIQNLNCELLKINETLEESNCELEEMNAQLEETNATFEEEISEHKITALELQETLRELSETKNYLNNILESSTKYSIIGKDLNHRILSWNEGAVRNYGYTAEQIIGKDSSTLYSPEDLKSGEVDKMLKLAFEKGVAEGELQRVRKDGSRFIASVVVTRRNDSTGDPIGYLLMSHDISEKKEEEAARKKSEEEIKK